LSRRDSQSFLLFERGLLLFEIVPACVKSGDGLTLRNE
jgi:hypothetical protein